MRRWLAALTLLGVPQCAAATVTQTDDSLLQRGWNRLAAAEPMLVSLRHDLHQHPEISGNESRTAAAIADRLRALGIEVRTGIGGQGVVGLLRGGRPGPLVAYRADMDAVPSTAPDPVAYASRTPGVRHICGHDVHVAVGIGVATALSAIRDSLPGSILFVFQPAEETAQGARAMLADGVFGKERPVAIYGVHTAGYEAGLVATMAGPMMAARDRAMITVSGREAVSLASRVTERLGAMATGTLGELGTNAPADFVVVFPGPRTVAGDSIQLRFGFGLADPARRRQLRQVVLEELPAMESGNTRLTATYQEAVLPGVTNDPALTLRAREAVIAAMGAEALRMPTGIPAAFSEDFGAFQAVVPGVFFYLGVSNAARGWRGYPHAPDYVADDRAILVGARAMSAVLLDRLQAGSARLSR